jgi:hypothetical protein
VALPFGLIGLYWVRSFTPLIAADLPQTPDSRAGTCLGFVKESFRRLAGLSAFELRVGAEFAGDAAIAVTGAILDAVRTIRDMPVVYITYLGNGRPVFDVTTGRTFEGKGARPR